MSPEEKSLILALATVPAGGKPLSPVEFLDKFQVTDGKGLGLDLLRSAVARHDSVDVELALIVCFVFGFSEAHVPHLCTLAFGEWHINHEDVASALSWIKSPESVEALVHLAVWVPGYLAFDDARALAVKAVWALHEIGNQESREALQLLTSSASGVVAQNARARLEM